MIYLDKTLRPLTEPGLKNLTLFRNDEITVWVQVREKLNTQTKGTEKNIQDFKIDLTDKDIEYYDNYYFTDDTFFIASTKLINSVNGGRDDWDYRNEENNYLNQNVITYLIQKFSEFITQKKPKCVLIVIDTEQNNLRPYYLWADIELVDIDLKYLDELNDDDPWKNFVQYLYSEELPKANDVWQNVEEVQNYMKRINLFAQHFYEVAKSRK